MSKKTTKRACSALKSCGDNPNAGKPKKPATKRQTQITGTLGPAVIAVLTTTPTNTTMTINPIRPPSVHIVAGASGPQKTTGRYNATAPDI